MLLKHPREVLRIFEPQLVGNFTHRLVPFENLRFRCIHQFQVNVFVRRFTRFLFDKVAKIVGRKIQFTRTISNGWQPYFLWFV